MKRFISVKAVKAVGILTLLFVAGGYTAAGSQPPPCDPNATGDILRSFHPSPDGPMSAGRAVAYDGATTLYYAVYTSSDPALTDHNIYISTTSGVFLGAIPLAGRDFL